MTELPRRADAVVIGGGVIGCSVAYHLAKAGAGAVVLLERERLGAGTTWHAAGNITWRPLESGADMVLYAYELLAALARETDIETGWTWTGRLFLARTRRGLNPFIRMAEAAEAAGIESRMLTPGEAARRNPLIDPAAIAGAWDNPRSGRLDPTNFTAALARAARGRGAQIVEDCEASGIETRGGAVSGVRTAGGAIATPVVILCAGLWSRDLAAELGVALAQGAVEHVYVIAAPAGGVPREMPSFVSPEDLIYGREEVGKMLVGCFDEDAKTVRPADLPAGFAFSLLAEDWDKIAPYYEKATEIFPALAEAPVRSFVNGPETFTPDGEPLVGAIAGVPGLHVASALNSHGITLAAGIGHLIADLVTGRRPRFDPAPRAPDRFASKAADEAWLDRAIRAAPSRSYRTANR